MSDLHWAVDTWDQGFTYANPIAEDVQIVGASSGGTSGSTDDSTPVRIVEVK